jgi:hypothetical protein
MSKNGARQNDRAGGAQANVAPKARKQTSRRRCANKHRAEGAQTNIAPEARKQ